VSARAAFVFGTAISTGANNMNASTTTAADSAATPLVRPKLPSHEVWASPLFAIASVGLFALVVNLMRYGFARDWLDPLGYIVALLKPIVFTFPGYLVLRVVLGKSDLSEEVSFAARALRRASLSVVCYAPVIWFYLVTSPTATQTFPIIAFSFGALAFWTPLIVDILRGVGKRGGFVLSLIWVALMIFAEAQSLLSWLAAGIEGRTS
jgi:hypothetical protein